MMGAQPGAEAGQMWGDLVHPMRGAWMAVEASVTRGMALGPTRAGRSLQR